MDQQYIAKIIITLNLKKMSLFYNVYKFNKKLILNKTNKKKLEKGKINSRRIVYSI